MLHRACSGDYLDFENLGAGHENIIIGDVVIVSVCTS